MICGNVQTANATVYIIDQVLSPAGLNDLGSVRAASDSSRTAALPHV